MYYEENITLPNGSKSQSIEKKMNLSISIDKHKQVKFLEKKYSYQLFEKQFQAQKTTFDQNSVVYILADKSLPYGEVMGVLKIVKNNGFSKVSLVTDG